jgi:hypothetical protein
VVRVLIAPPISRRTAEISRGCPKYPRIGAFPPVRLGLWILALCLDGRVKELKQDHHCHDYHPKLDVYIQGKIINQPLPPFGGLPIRGWIISRFQGSDIRTYQLRISRSGYLAV